MVNPAKKSLAGVFGRAFASNDPKDKAFCQPAGQAYPRLPGFDAVAETLGVGAICAVVAGFWASLRRRGDQVVAGCGDGAGASRRVGTVLMH